MFALTLWSALSRLIGMNLREWAEWAEANPGAAAGWLETLAQIKEYRSRTRRWKWRARRELATARALRAQAVAMRKRALARPRQLRAICAVAPGTYSEAST